MRARVFETVAGPNFSVKEGTVVTSKRLDTSDPDARHLPETIIQSLINQGVAAELPDKVKK